MVCGLLALAVPWGLDRYGLAKGAELIGRPITAEKIRFNPFTLRLVAQGLRVGGPQAPDQAEARTTGADAAPADDAASGSDMFRLAELDLNLSILSVRYLAPVIEGLRLVGPDLKVVRLPDGRFDFHDIIERIEALPPSEPKPDDADKGPAKFAFHNIEIVDGQAHFDDRQLAEKHDITALQVGLPFISTLPADVETLVMPALAAVIDGSPLKLDGDTLPFHESRRTHLDVRLDDLVIGKYLRLSPTPLGFTSPEGKLSLDLKVGFHQDAAGSHLTIDGPVTVDELALDAAGGDRLVSLRRLEARLANLEPLISRFPVDSVDVDGLDVKIDREADGRLPIVEAFTPKAKPAKPAEARAADSTSADKASGDGDLDWSIAKTTVRGSRITVTDRTTTPPVKLDQHDISVDLGQIGNRQPAAAPITVAIKHNESGRIDWKGELDLAKSRAAGQFDVALPGIVDYLPYLAGALAATPSTGPITIGSAFESHWRGEVALTLSDGKVAVETAQLALPDDKAKEAAVRLGRVAVEGLGLSLTERQVKIERALLAKADLRVLRDARGQLNLSRITASGQQAAAAVDAKAGARTKSSAAARGARSRPAAPKAEAGAAKAGPAWVVAVARVDLEDNKVEWQDRATPSPVNLPISRLSGSIANVGTKLDQSANADLRMTVGRAGQLTVKGKAVPEPLSLDMNLQWRNLALAVIDPYLADSIGVELRRADATGNGRLRYGNDRARFAGRLAVTGLDATERRTGDELLRWKTLNIGGIDADVLTATGKGPRRGPADRVSIGEIALSDFFARVELSPEGRLNISDLLKSSDEPGGKGANGANGSKGAKAGDETAKAGDKATRSGQAAKNDGPPMQMRIGGISLKDGAANFTDHFVRPNYSADLSGLNGTISAMASEGAEPADVDVNGLVNGDAPIKIGGKLNPLGPTLYTDITASAKGIDLPTFSPYSGKYAGYIIEKGKLSLDVHYEIEQEKLKASNRIFLDQLTFGDKVDSPDATSLPVQFAIGLLKNGKGEIDLNLPISGSLDDPEFSFGGIIWNAFVNLITKIVTSPFTALASAFGGGEELSFVEFEPGTAVLTADSMKRLETITQALTDRPALKLEITGRMDPKAEARAFGKARLEQRLQALHRGRDEAEDEPALDPKGADAKGATDAKSAPDAKGSQDARGGQAEKGGTSRASAGESAGSTSQAPAAPLPPARREALVKRLAQTLKVPLTEPAPAEAKADSAKGDAAKTDAAKTDAAKGDAGKNGAASPEAGLEARVAAALAADPEAQRNLAIRRSQAPRNRLVSQGKIDPERIFLMAPKVAVGAADKAPAAEAGKVDGGGDAGAPGSESAGADEKQCSRDCATFSLR